MMNPFFVTLGFSIATCNRYHHTWIFSSVCRFEGAREELFEYIIARPAPSSTGNSITNPCINAGTWSFIAPFNNNKKQQNDFGNKSMTTAEINHEHTYHEES
mmetsp:Transcript_17773/g.31320  ORF Transcript_17773/g.31320 Transcript_17773/m.31320 type:complete len:102 (+) Transcript_17773:1164-1469(+)